MFLVAGANKETGKGYMALVSDSIILKAILHNAAKICHRYLKRLRKFSLRSCLSDIQVTNVIKDLSHFPTSTDFHICLCIFICSVCLCV